MNSKRERELASLVTTLLTTGVWTEHGITFSPDTNVEALKAKAIYALAIVPNRHKLHPFNESVLVFMQRFNRALMVAEIREGMNLSIADAGKTSSAVKNMEARGLTVRCQETRGWLLTAAGRAHRAF
jgi:hypothetical protein